MNMLPFAAEEIRIFSHQGLHEFLLQHADARDTVHITDSDVACLPFLRERAGNHLHLQFDDVATASSAFRSPSLADVQRAIDWSADKRHLAVACHAGVSRSSALAYVIACTRLAPADAIRVLDPARHAPNSLVVTLGSRVLNNPGVLKAFADFQADQRPLLLKNLWVSVVQHNGQIDDESAAIQVRQRDFVQVAVQAGFTQDEVARFLQGR
ncbi:MAG: hypothetical protein JNM56_22385 [Planctomycetia bacterium]|nr:hypothetical protein [Planctomycetia bacterium]